MKRIKRFGVLQTAKVAAIIYFLIAAVIMIPIGLFSSFLGSENFFPFGGVLFFVLMPFLYGIIAFIMTAIGCWVYNIIANWTGGIELEVDSTDFNIK